MKEYNMIFDIVGRKLLNKTGINRLERVNYE